MIGEDNTPNSTSEFVQEGAPRTDQKYYWENGNYSSVVGRTGAGVNWSGGQEPFKDETSSLGFSRTIISNCSSHDIFFQITPEMVAAGNQFRLEIEFYGA